MATEKTIYALLISTINAGLTALGYEGIVAQQADQPATQGVPTGAIVLISNVGTHPYGWPKITDIWDAGESVMNHTETQAYEVTMQFGTLFPQDPADTSGPTANDLLKSVRYILQNLITRAAFLTAGIGFERVTQIRQPYFTDDMEKFEASPSFDCVFTYSDAITVVEPSTNVVEPGLYPI